MRRQLLVQRTASDRLGQQLRYRAAGVVDGLSHLNGTATVGVGIDQPGGPRRIDLHFERDSELATVAQHHLVLRRNTRRTCIPIEAGIELTSLPGAVEHRQLGIAPKGPVAAAAAASGFNHRAVVSGSAELIRS